MRFERSDRGEARMEESENVGKVAGIDPSEQLIQQLGPSIYETHNTDKRLEHERAAPVTPLRFNRTKIYQNNYNRWDIHGEEFDLPSNYAVMEYMGAGAYGIVVSALDRNKDETVAIKKCRNIFQSRTLTKRTLRELRLLRLIDHPNIIKVKNVLRPIDCVNFLNIYIIFDLMESDLASIIRSSQPLNDLHIRYFTAQLLSGLQYLHYNNIVHRDIKPRNILVNGDCLLKIADFGLARYYHENVNDRKILAMTEYVTTRWYRAPEILVGWHKYSSAIDIWALGCIIAELLGRTPILPGCDSKSQIDCICKLMGKPNILFIKQAKKPQAKQYLYDLPQYNPVNFSTLFPTSSSLLLEERITAALALQHPYIMRGKWIPSFASALKMAYNPEDFSFEMEKHTIGILRQQLLKETAHYENVLPKSDIVIDDNTDNVSSDDNALTVSCESEKLVKEIEPVTKPSPNDKSRSSNPHAYIAKGPPDSSRRCSIM